MPKKRLLLILTAAAVFAVAPSGRSQAQIIYPFPYRYPISADASVRIEATPKDAEVFVDGYYAGVVDDFDGAFQRLHASPGQHEITIYRDGYRTARQMLYLMPDRTFRLKVRIEPLAPGEAGEARPTPAPPPAAQGPTGPLGGRLGAPLPRGGRRLPQPAPLPLPPPTEERPATGAPLPAPAGVGTIALQLQPADADILIDGQPWSAAQNQNSFAVDVSAGRHVVQIRKAGYIGYLTEVEVRNGETTTLDVNLRKQP